MQIKNMYVVIEWYVEIYENTTAYTKYHQTLAKVLCCTGMFGENYDTKYKWSSYNC